MPQNQQPITVYPADTVLAGLPIPLRDSVEEGRQRGLMRRAMIPLMQSLRERRQRARLHRA